MAVKPIRITCEIQNPVRHRPAPARGIVGYDTIPGFADYVLGRANVLPDDVIMIGSVSGYQYFPVDLALKANEMGLRDRGCHIGGIFGASYQQAPQRQAPV